MRRTLTPIFCTVLFLAARPLAMAASNTTVPDGFSFVAGGDMIGPYHPIDRSDAAFLRVASLFQHADLGFANQEGSIFDLATFPGYPAAENGGGYPLQAPAAAQEFKAMGIALVSKANNHATDWGDEGLVETLRSLAAAGVVQAGCGLSETEARAPAYVRTPMGLAALVDTASTFPPMAVAGGPVQRRGVASRPRPGISALHVREVRLVTADQLAALRQAISQGGAASDTLRIGDQVFRSSVHTGTKWEMDPADLTAILASVHEARSTARFVVFSIHAHETAGHDDVPAAAAFEPMVLHKANEAPSPNDPRPAGFEPELFHAAIDAGADVVIRTGPHTLNGIEIYKGKPIFYSLGSLFFDFGGRRSYTSVAGEKLTFPDEWFESIVPVSTFKGGKLSQMRLYPVTIESGSAATSGVPHLADPERARRILERVRTESAAFGTEVVIENNVGIIRADMR